jgi:hypothetical protein
VVKYSNNVARPERALLLLRSGPVDGAIRQQ